MRAEYKIEDFIGKKFGFVTVIGETVKYYKNNQKQKHFLFLCECGEQGSTHPLYLVNGRVISCGCKALMKVKEKAHQKLLDVVGERFGRLVVTGAADDYIDHKNHTHKMANVVCDCGNVKSVLLKSLLKGSTNSCGCLHKEVVSNYCKENYTVHGETNTRLYRIYRHILSRCYNKNSKVYPNYGGRGISVCQRWRDSYENFKEDMSTGYRDDLSIDRVDTNGNYTPENCRWADGAVQSHNTNKKHRNGTTTSVYRGVHNKGDNRTRPWVATMRMHGVRYDLGSYSDEYEAALAYDNKSEELYGDRPNNTQRRS